MANLESSGAFWTSCDSCKLNLQYTTNYRGRNLLCPKCHKPFRANEIPAPIIPNLTNQNATPGTSEASRRQSLVSTPNILKKQKKNNSLKEKKSMASAVSKRKRPTSRWEYKKMEKSKTPSSDEPEASRRNCYKAKDSNFSPRIKFMKAVFSQEDSRRLLMMRARKGIQEKFKDQNFTIESSQEAFKDQNFVIEAFKSSDKETNLKKKTQGILSLNKKKPRQEKTLSVPDADFYDFDKDRTEMAFRPNQIWAAYDDKDNMPRFYAMIQDVFSLKPFKISVSWLNSRSSNELGSNNWISSGFYKTSGNFCLGKKVLVESISSFSLMVKWAKGQKWVVKIYPKKGDVWAVYKNWSNDWDAFTPTEIVNRYDMVTVIDDFDENRGVAVWPLIKVSGFKTVFRLHANANTIRTFPKNELFRFSHQVASYPLTGKEFPNAPEGCLELDPAAMSAELLEVLNDEQVKEMEDLFEKTAKETETKPKETGGKGSAEGTEND